MSISSKQHLSISEAKAHQEINRVDREYLQRIEYIRNHNTKTK